MSTSPSGMAESHSRRTPAFAPVFRAHVALVARLGWVELGVCMAAIWALCAWAASMVRGVPVHSYVDRQLAMHFVALVFAAYWPLAAWRDEAPRQRATLWCLPLRREHGTWVRVLAGLLLLIGALVVANLGGFVIGTAIGRAAEFAPVSPLAWLASGLGVTIVYLLASAIAVASDVAGRWILALAVLVYAPPLMLPMPEVLSWAIRPGPLWLYHGPLGFERATRLAVTQAQLDSRLSEFTPDLWLPASLAWLTLGTALVWLAARRRIDL